MPPILDKTCAAAKDLARTAAEERCGVFKVGAYLKAVAEDSCLVTHLFNCEHPGYQGWQWAVTVTRVPRSKTVTVSEVCLVPGEKALLAPQWVPWAERVSREDLVPGVVLPTADDDPRLDPGFVGDEKDRDEDPAEWAQTRAVVRELGLGRQRVLSAYGREIAAQRWLESEGGPQNQMSKQAPGQCQDCGYFIRLSGSLGLVFGACANEYSPSDAQVVAINHGCGAHSDIVEPTRKPAPALPVWDTVATDTLLFD